MSPDWGEEVTKKARYKDGQNQPHKPRERWDNLNPARDWGVQLLLKSK